MGQTCKILRLDLLRTVSGLLFPPVLIRRWFYLLLVLPASSSLRASDAGSSFAAELNQPEQREFQSSLSIDSVPSLETRIQGVVTFSDSQRQLVVLQQDSHSQALRLQPLFQELQPGDWVELEGHFNPLISVLPDFPDRAAAARVLAAFEAPTDWGDDSLSRLRGVLHPPSPGLYTFWIASDDSSELWLREIGNPTEAKKIAEVPSGRWTELRQWNRIASQQSREIQLDSGKSYLIEALGQNAGGRSCLSVAWKGPEIEQSVIDAKYLTLPNSTRRGALWECWTNFISADISVLKAANTNVLICRDARVIHREKVRFPEAIPVPMGTRLEPGLSYRRVNIEGRLGLVSDSEGQLRMELKRADSTIVVRGLSSDGMNAVLPRDSVVWARGVLEPAFSLNENSFSGTLWMRPGDLAWSESDENWSIVPAIPSHQFQPANSRLAVNEIIHARGRMVKEEAPGIWSVQGADTFHAYASSNGVNWISLGAPVELSLEDSMFLGFAVASHQDDQLAAVRFDHLTGISTNFSGITFGSTGVRGDFRFADGTCLVRGNGNDIWAQADECFLAYEPVTGGFEVTVHLGEIVSVDPRAKVVLMARESLAANSRWVGIAMLSGDRIGLQSRLEPGKNATGLLSVQPLKWFRLVRQRNTFLIHAADRQLQAGMAIDALGRLKWQQRIPLLDPVRIRVAKKTSAETAALSGRPADLTGALHDVRIVDLKAEAEAARQAAHQLRTRIRGVLTFNASVDGEWLTFVQDETGGARVQWRQTGAQSELQAGDYVEITGSLTTDTSEPEIQANGAGRLGRGEMPPPIPFETVAFNKNAAIGKWVQVDGIVRGVNSNRDLSLMTASRLLSVRTPLREQAGGANWVNALVRIRGVLWQNPEPTLLLPSLEFLDITEAAPEDPFSIPVFSISSLEGLSESWRGSRRLKISGAVTCRRDQFLVLEDGTGGIRVEMESAPDVAIGQVVEAVGFPSRRGTAMFLSEALIRTLDERRSVSAMLLSEMNLASSRGRYLLASVEAILLQQHTGRAMQTLDLQIGQRAFRATLPLANGRLNRIEPGSRVRVSGVSVVEEVDASPERRPSGVSALAGSMQLLLRSPADLQVIERPPWWNWKYTVTTIALVVVIFFCAVLWIRTLRRRVEERTRELRETMVKLNRETQVSATLAERDRLAGEIHDSVEQGLSAIVMQMEAAAKLVDKPNEIQRYLSMAKNMASFSRTEVQHAVWDMQSPLLENADLSTALRRVAQDISAGDASLVTVDVRGAVFPLTSAVEHHLLRIAQEAITNAVKHGNPRTIFLELQYLPEAVMLMVRDDGNGFAPEAVSTEGGHFGLQGMRGRAMKIGAELTVSSRPGDGTTVRIVVPRESAASQLEMTAHSIQK